MHCDTHVGPKLVLPGSAKYADSERVRKHFPLFPLSELKGTLKLYLVSLNFSVLTAGSIYSHMVIEKSQSQKQAEMSENNNLNKYSVLVWMTRQVEKTAGSQLPEA